MIARGSEPGLVDAIKSVRAAVDEAILVLTGTPGERALARRRMRGLKTKCFDFDWCDDFAAARNESFRHASGDWLFWIDSDDTVENAAQLRNLVVEAEQRGWGCVHLTYVFRTDEHGNPTVVHNRERLMKRSLGWSWRDRVHEHCNADTAHLVGYSDDVRIIHHPVGIHTDRNLRLLQLMEQENPEYPRMLVGIADCYFSQGNFTQALEYYRRYYERAESSVRQWDSAVNCARSAFKLAQENPIYWQDVVNWCQAAIAIHPEFADPYIYMAHATWWANKDAERALLWLSMADDKAQAPLETQRHPYDYTLNRWDVEHRALANLGRWAEALDVVQRALELTHDSPEWRWFFWGYLEALNSERSVQAVEALCDHLVRRGDTLRALKLVDECVPVTAREDARFKRIRARIYEITRHVFSDEAYQEFYNSEHNGEALNAPAVTLERYPQIARLLQQAGAKRVLDVGCGAGEPAIWLASKGFDVVGLDINQEAIKHAKKRWTEYQLGRKPTPMNDRQFLLPSGVLAEPRGLEDPIPDAPGGSAEFHLGTLETMGPKDLGQFDAVIISEVIEHLPPQKVPFYIGCADDLLHEGGSLIITCPGMLVGDIPGLWATFPRDHVTEFTREDLERLLTFPPGTREIWNLHKVYAPNVSVPGFAHWFAETRKGISVKPEPVVIYAGPGLEQWTPDQPEQQGLGGSETWVVNVARELRRQGHPVVVYAEADGVWDGVIYRHYSKFTPQAAALGIEPWLLIVSRYIELLDEELKAEHLLFMAHDTDYGDAVTPERVSKLDAYCVLSDWHKQHTLERYPFLEGKLRLVSNGINPEYFTGEAERVPHSFIWSSSPDRGLDYFLDAIWPQVLERWPDATLDVFYGFDNLDKLAEARPWLGQFKVQLLDRARRLPGVRLRGRIGQRELAREMLKHEYWVYPSITPQGSDWHETYCITALEAQAAGLKCVTVPVGALSERALPGGCYVLAARDALVPTLFSLENAEAARADTSGVTWEQAVQRILEAVTAQV